MRITQKHRHRRGFTLIEVMVVVIVIGVLAAVIMPTFFGRAERAKRAVARQNIATLSTAITLFMQDYSRLPESLDELVNRPADIPEDQWLPTGIQSKDLIDPWGNPYVYEVPGNHNNYYDLYSLGSDGQPGGEGDAADVTNWESS